MDWQAQPSVCPTGSKRLMKKVIIVATSFDEHELLSGVAQHHSPGTYQFEVTASFGQTPEWWKDKNPDLVILSLPEEDPYLSFFMSKLKNETHRELKMLWIAKDISTDLMQLSTQFDRVRIMKRPLEDFSFYRAMVDMTADYEEGKLQTHPRYVTDLDVKVQKKLSKETFIMRMKNLSRGGTFLEAQNQSLSMNMGDVLEIDIFLESLGREYKFEGEVVWRQEPTATRSLGLGVRFVQSSINKDVLEKLES